MQWFLFYIKYFKLFKCKNINVFNSHAGSVHHSQSAYRHIERQSSSVCVSVGEKLLRLQNALLIHDGHRTQTKDDDVTRPCARDFPRVVKSSEACSSPSARAIITHTWTSVSTYCLAHKDALAIRVTARARREPRGCQCFLGVDLKEKNIFDPFAEFWICCIVYQFH